MTEEESTPQLVHTKRETEARSGIGLNIAGRPELQDYRILNRFMLEGPKGNCLIRTCEGKVWDFDYRRAGNGEFDIKWRQTNIGPWYQGELSDPDSIVIAGIYAKELTPILKKGQNEFKVEYGPEGFELRGFEQEGIVLKGVKPKGSIVFPVGDDVVVEFDLTLNGISTSINYAIE